ncbi:MAG: prolyl oligopeptidase family serine peptidase [Acidobacteriota bacterium]
MRTTLLRASACLAGCVSVLAAGLAGQETAPSIDDILNLKRVASPTVSPDGQRVAYTVREANWDDNDYETEIWVGDARGTRQLTSARKSSQQPAWSPDGRWLAFISDRDGKRQIYRIAIAGGEAERLTATDEGVTSFAWAPDGSQIVFSMTDAIDESIKQRERQFGDLRFEDEDRRMVHLHLVKVPGEGTAASSVASSRRLTSGAFVVGGFDWAPDGASIAFDHRVSSDPAEGASADISVVDIASGTRTPVVTQAGPDVSPRWSPDGSRLAFVSSVGRPFHFYENDVIAAVTPGRPEIEVLTREFDENPSLIAWTKRGIFFGASNRTWAYLFQLDPMSKQITRHAPADAWIGSGFSITRDGERVALVASGPSEFPDVFLGQVGAAPGGSPGRAAQVGLSLTRMSQLARQIGSWPSHQRGVVRWKSQDGTEIEGVLHKPSNFHEGRRYPLLVVIHGGPTGVSRPVPYTNGVGYYPIDAWLSRGALVLEPNYRGSAGYGQKFRSLNVRNLGIGDAWDVLSGIDHLVSLGLVDASRVGAMGWSQGGYISAFLTTRHADRFKALSVGAGISNWMTYYVNTDIHPFTRQYLKATPWDDPKIYADTSPMTYIKGAKTPTLIQHGDQDQRVPVPNAFELYQGLRDQNVPTRLVLFRGFGHPLNKPKANRAAMQQNWEWFDKFMWGATSSQ